jgi:hypothetical protein
MDDRLAGSSVGGKSAARVGMASKRITKVMNARRNRLNPNNPATAPLIPDWTEGLDRPV